MGLALLQMLALKAVGAMAGKFELAIAPASLYLKRVTVGLTFVGLSLVAGGLALFFLLLTFFFVMGNAESLVAPALATGLISLSIGSIGAFWGLNLLRYR